MKKKSTPTPRRGPARSRVRALIPLDTAKIRHAELNKFKKNKATHATLSAQIKQFEQKESPAFAKWMHSVCGDLQEKIDAVYSESSTLDHTLLIVEGLQNFYPERTEKACADAAVYYMETEGKAPEGFEEFFNPPEDPESDPSSSFKDEEEDPFSEDRSSFFEDSDPDRYATARSQADRAAETRTIKKLYRDIIRKLHPDRTGRPTPEQQELWHAAQKAYDMRDVETLEHIAAHGELLDKKKIHSAAISSIRNGIHFYKKANTRIRRTIRQMKDQPQWGFLSWTEKKKKNLSKRFTIEMKADLQYLTARKAAMQRLLDRLRTPEGKRSDRHQGQSSFDFF